MMPCFCTRKTLDKRQKSLNEMYFLRLLLFGCTKAIKYNRYSKQRQHNKIRNENRKRNSTRKKKKQGKTTPKIIHDLIRDQSPKMGT